jgi:hypothetical protein
VLEPCRAQEDFFFAHIPGSVLLVAASFSLAIFTVPILACWWPEGTLNRIAVMGLARGDCKLMPLWIWLYSIFFYFIQDSTKIICIYSLQSLPSMSENENINNVARQRSEAGFRMSTRSIYRSLAFQTAISNDSNLEDLWSVIAINMESTSKTTKIETSSFFRCFASPDQVLFHSLVKHSRDQISAVWQGHFV